MLSSEDYASHDGLGLAALVKDGLVHPRELVEAAIARIERLNPRLNAVIHRMYEGARAAAERPVSGPFAGVPFLAKDLVSAWAGEPLAMGTRLLRDYRAPADSEIVRYRRAGLIALGRTNTPELGLVPVTEPEAYGASRNPWDPSRTPGGSSGGSAAAVAARMVPLAGGGDGGGSIRIPASCCGLFGLKPTRARTPLGPSIGEAWQGCVVEHVLTRSVRDSAAMLDALAGPDAGEPYVAPPPARPFLDEVGADPNRLRIAITTRGLLPAEVHPECVRAAEAAAALCRDLGHEVLVEHPRFDAEQFSLDFLTMIIGETAADVREAEALAGRKVARGDLEAPTVLLALLGEAVTAVDFALAARRLKRLGHQLADFFTRYDVLLTPTLADLPLAVGTLLPRGAEKLFLEAMTRLRAGRLVQRLGTLPRIAANAWSFTPFTAPFNATGQPACSVPLHFTADGLPVGVQLVGRFGDEATLIRLSSQLEAARPWKDRRPRE